MHFGPGPKTDSVKVKVSDGSYLSFTTNYPVVYPVEGFDAATKLEVFRVFDPAEKSHSFVWAGRSYEIHWVSGSMTVEIRHEGRPLIGLDVNDVVEQASDYLGLKPGASKFSIPQELLSLQKENDQIRVRAYFEDLSVDVRDNRKSMAHFKSDIFIKFKKL